MSKPTLPIGSWLWTPISDMFTPVLLTPSAHDDPTATILHITESGGFIANMQGDEPGRWWVMQPAMSGNARFTLARTFDMAKAANYYYHDFVTRITINKAGEITANKRTWAKP